MTTSSQLNSTNVTNSNIYSRISDENKIKEKSDISSNNAKVRATEKTQGQIALSNTIKKFSSQFAYGEVFNIATKMFKVDPKKIDFNKLIKTSDSQQTFTRNLRKAIAKEIDATTSAPKALLLKAALSTFFFIRILNFVGTVLSVATESCLQNLANKGLNKLETMLENKEHLNMIKDLCSWLSNVLNEFEKLNDKDKTLDAFINLLIKNLNSARGNGPQSQAELKKDFTSRLTKALISHLKDESANTKTRFILWAFRKWLPRLQCMVEKLLMHPVKKIKKSRISYQIKGVKVITKCAKSGAKAIRKKSDKAAKKNKKSNDVTSQKSHEASKAAAPKKTVSKDYEEIAQKMNEIKDHIIEKSLRQQLLPIIMAEVGGKSELGRLMGASVKTISDCLGITEKSYELFADQFDKQVKYQGEKIVKNIVSTLESKIQEFQQDPSTYLNSIAEKAIINENKAADQTAQDSKKAKAKNALEQQSPEQQKARSIEKEAREKMIENELKKAKKKMSKEKFKQFRKAFLKQEKARLQQQKLLESKKELSETLNDAVYNLPEEILDKATKAYLPKGKAGTAIKTGIGIANTGLNAVERGLDIVNYTLDNPRQAAWDGANKVIDGVQATGDMLDAAKQSTVSALNSIKDTGLSAAKQGVEMLAYAYNQPSKATSSAKDAVLSWWSGKSSESQPAKEQPALQPAQLKARPNNPSKPIANQNTAVPPKVVAGVIGKIQAAFSTFIKNSVNTATEELTKEELIDSGTNMALELFVQAVEDVS